LTLNQHHFKCANLIPRLHKMHLEVRIL